MHEEETQRALSAISRAAEAAAPIAKHELERAYGPAWLEEVNARRAAHGYSAGRGTHDHRFVLALVAHDPALAQSFDAGQREAARRLNGMGNAIAHNEPLGGDDPSRAEELAQRLVGGGLTKVPLPAAKPPPQKRRSARPPQRAHPRQPERDRTRRPSPSPGRPPVPAGPPPHGRTLAAIGGRVALGLVVLCLAAWLLLTLLDDGRGDRARDALAVGTLQQTRDVSQLDLSESETARILAETGEIEVRLGDDGEGLRSDLACARSEAWRLTDHDTIDVCVLVDPDSGRLLGSFERLRNKPRLVGANCTGQTVTEQVRCRDR